EQWDFARGLRWGAAGVRARHGVDAHQIADYLALCGDAIDNIPGVPGIGAKTAAVLLSHFGSLDALLARVDVVGFLRFRAASQAATTLRMHQAQALLSRHLTIISRDAPLGTAAPRFARANADADALADLCAHLRVGPLTRRRLYGAAGLGDPPLP